MFSEEKQYNKMTKTPVNKLVISLAIPTIISMLVTSIYNLADTFFVSRLGVSASGAVGVVFPLMAIIQAIGFTLGMGGGSNISAKLGEKDNEGAQRIGSSAFYLALAVGTLLTILGIIFLKDLLYLLGSTDTILPYAYNYAKYIVYGAPIMTASFVLNNILRSEGKAKFSMIGLSIGGLLNIGLDPLFIYGFKLGISGAAIATLISQCISFTIMLLFFILKKSIITLKPIYIAKRFKEYFEIINVGFPSFARQGFASISTVLLNSAAGSIAGDPALSGMSIVGKIVQIVFSIALGIGQGYQPVVGYNYSSKNYDRVKKAFKFTFISCTIVMSVMGIFFYISSDGIIKLFMDSKETEVDKVIAIGGQALRYQCLAMPLMGVNLICNMSFQATRKKSLATLLSLYRQGIFFIPLVLILPNFLNLTGVQLIQPLSDLLSCLCSIPFFIYFIRHLNIKINENL